MLVERLFGDRPIPDGFDLMSELICRVRAEEIRLVPTEESGWYGHQTRSLEPLVIPDRLPEATRLELGERYRQHLEDCFAVPSHWPARRMSSSWPSPRSAVGCARPPQQPICVRPGLSVEPLPEVYARRAASYRFVRAVLEDAFGADALAGIHRLTQEGPVAAGLADELEVMEKLFDGAAATARRELGMEPGTGDEEAADRFSGWKACLAQDPDVSRDCQMVVPVFFDLQRRKTKVWAFLGWRPVPVDVKYRKDPAVPGVEREPPPEPEPTDRFTLLKRKFRRQLEAVLAGSPSVITSARKILTRGDGPGSITWARKKVTRGDCPGSIRWKRPGALAA